jgi:hypothetical protein
MSIRALYTNVYTVKRTLRPYVEIDGRVFTARQAMTYGRKIVEAATKAFEKQNRAEAKAAFSKPKNKAK